MKVRNAMLAVLSVVLVPAVSSAVTLTETFGLINRLINALIPIVISIAILYFFWALANYLLKAGDDGAQKEMRYAMIYGVLAIFVMVSIWGFVRLLQSTFKVNSTDPIVPRAIDINDAFR